MTNGFQLSGAYVDEWPSLLSYEAEFAAAVRDVVRPKELLAIDAVLQNDVSRRMAHRHFLACASTSPLAIAAATR